VAEEVYTVAFDIQAAGASNAYFSKTEGGIVPKGVFGVSKETSLGNAEFEGKGASNGTNGTKSGFLAHQGCVVVQCKMVELLSGSAAEAVEVVREKLASNPGGERAVVKPNETNFKVVV